MRYEEQEHWIRIAMEHAAPNEPDKLLASCTERKGKVILMTEPRKKHSRALFAAVAAALVLVIAGGAFGRNVWQANAVACTVSLDVNPSIELKVNRQEHVLSCTPLNGDAAQVLFEMNGGADLEGAKLGVAVNALVGALVRHGYLESISSALLISVEDSDQARADRLQQELTATVATFLEQQSAAAAVYGQTVTQDAGLNQIAQANNISAGKAALVNQVLALNGTLEFEKLAGLSVEELNQLILVGAPAVPIGIAQARYLAEQYAGTLSMDGVMTDVEPDLNDAVPHYEVELILASGTDYDYKVDAYTGAILSGQPDVVTAGTAMITAEQARNAALTHMAAQYPALSNHNVFDLSDRTETDGGKTEYHVSFYCGGYEFEYEVDAATGAVLDWSMEYRGPATATDPGAQTTADPAASSPSPSAAAGTSLTQEQAKTVALNHAGLTAGQVTGMRVERDYDNGRLEYDIEFWSGNVEYDYTVRASDGAILKQEKDDHGTQVSPSATAVTQEQAKTIALNHAGLTAGQVTGMRVEQDYDNGRLEYDIEFWSGNVEYDYTVRAADGAILKQEKDDHGAQASAAPAPSQTAASTYIGESAAKNAAYAHANCQAGDVTFVTCKLDYDDRCYEVDFVCGSYEYEYEIDCYTGGVLKHSCESHGSSHHGDTHHSSGTAAQTYIGQSAALSAAYTHAGVSASDAFGVKVELDWENNRMIYEVEFQVGRTEYEYEIDATTGSVLKYETDWDD